MSEKTPQLTDRSGHLYAVDQPRWSGDDGAPLLRHPLPGITRRQIDTSVNSQWRYRAALPPTGAEPVTLGEGRTPCCGGPSPDSRQSSSPSP